MSSSLRPTLFLTLLSLFLACLIPSGSSWAHVLFDFEQPYFVEELEVYCKDHALIKVDGTYHVYYIHSFPPVSGYLRSEKWLGHLTSDDLRHWTRQDSILPVAEVPDSWEDTAIWAPKIIVNSETGAWFLYYTGVDQNVTQQAGLAWSWDLVDWVRWPLNPIYHPGGWAAWQEGVWSNCRDPEIFHLDGEDDYYLLNTVSMHDGRGAISCAVSQNLISWTDQGPFFVNTSAAMLESPQLLFNNDAYHLFFTEEGVQGTSHISNAHFWEGWTKDNLTIIDVGNAPEISRLEGGEDNFSRHDAISTPDGPLFYLRFDEINLDTPDDIPEIVSLGGLSEDWTVIFGNAFDNQPTWGDNPYQRGDGHSHMEGNSYIATYENFPLPLTGHNGETQGTVLTGLMRTPSFTVTGNRLRLLVGGGNKPEICFVGLVREADERLLFLETGNDSYAMDLRIWNCSTLLGETAYLVIADLGMRDWEHISTDSIEEYDESGQDPVTPSDPLDPGPLLDDILAAAGFVITGCPEPQQAAAPPGRLLAPHPNPFNPRTHLRYELEREGLVELVILDASGHRVRELFSGRLGPGPGFFTWDGRDDRGQALASGLYLARLHLDGAHQGSRKLVLIR